MNQSLKETKYRLFPIISKSSSESPKAKIILKYVLQERRSFLWWNYWANYFTKDILELRGSKIELSGYVDHLIDITYLYPEL